MSVCQYITNCWWPTETSLDFSTFASALLIFFTAQKRRERTQLDGGYIKKLNRRGERAHKKKCPDEPEKGDWPETPRRSSRRFPNGRIFLQSKKCTIKSRVFLGFVFFIYFAVVSVEWRLLQVSNLFYHFASFSIFILLCPDSSLLLMVTYHFSNCCCVVESYENITSLKDLFCAHHTQV